MAVRLTFARVLVLLAVLTGALLPVGFMPDANKAFAITICHGADTQTIYLSGDQAPVQEKQQDNKTCAFTPLSFAAHSFDAPIAFFIALALLFAGALIFATPILTLAFKGRPNQSRAPPISV